MTFFGKLFRTDKNGIYREVETPDFEYVQPTFKFPHCDTLILHRPGTCEYCDTHPDWQEMRQRQGIAFSNDSEEHVKAWNLVPCPSTYRRPAEVRDKWYGNVPTRGTL